MLRSHKLKGVRTQGVWPDLFDGRTVVKREPHIGSQIGWSAEIVGSVYRNDLFGNGNRGAGLVPLVFDLTVHRFRKIPCCRTGIGGVGGRGRIVAQVAVHGDVRVNHVVGNQ